MQIEAKKSWDINKQEVAKPKSGSRCASDTRALKKMRRHRYFRKLSLYVYCGCEKESKMCDLIISFDILMVEVFHFNANL